MLYATSLERERREYGFLPGGPESAIYKTVDAGKTWTQLKQGLPTGEMGRIGLSICKSRPSIVYAMVHAKAPANGLYRSDDAGANWHLVNDVNGTAWYYSQVRCDPTDPDHVITLSAASRESHDGGKTMTPFAAAPVHSDHHALWINDENAQNMILGGDGGLYTTWDAGKTWDHNESVVVGQFYAIAVDDAQPFYNVYGGLQDNQTWGGPSRTRNAFGPTNADWFRMAGGDGFYAVPDPRDQSFVYAESQSGGVVRYDARTGQTKNIKPVPKAGERDRYNWSAPILPSAHDPKTVYLAANYLFKSPDRGDTWEKISPDLTRGIDRNKLPMRAAIPDSSALGRNEGTAEFSNIATMDESSFKPGLLVVGTDDGLIQVTRDGGKTWTKSDKFPNVPDTTFVSRVVWSRANEGTIYATFDGHRSNDFKPYVVKSVDYGKTWTSITGDLPDGGSVQVVREHPRQPNLLFVGTEFGVYFSADAGTHWTQLKSGIPGVPVYDLQIQARANDLVVGTHGRGIYILDDLSPLEHLAKAKQASVAFLFPTQDALLFQANTSKNSGMGTRGYHRTESGSGAAHCVFAQAVGREGLALGGGRERHRRSRTAGEQSARAPSHLVGHARWSAAHWTGRYARASRRTRGAVVAAVVVVQAPVARRRRIPRDAVVLRVAPAAGAVVRPTQHSRHCPANTSARLTVTPTTGSPTVLEQSFNLTKDPMVILADADLKQLYAFRLDVMKAQRTPARKAGAARHGTAALHRGEARGRFLRRRRSRRS